MAIADKVKNIIKEVGEIDDNIEDHFSLEDYGFDSMDLIDLVARLEDLVDEDLYDEQLFQRNLRDITVGKIIDLVKAHC